MDADGRYPVGQTEQVTGGVATDRQWFRQVLGQYPTGVAVITAREADRSPVAMVVGTFTSISLDPPLVGFLADHSSTSWPRIRSAGHFCANILSAQQEHVCRAFAAKAPDRFESHLRNDAATGSPVLAGTSAWIDCDLETVVPVGDHDLAVGRVRELGVGEAVGPPLIFLRGGYGSPIIPFVQAEGPDLERQLRYADLARDQMRAIADDLQLSCTASAVVNGAVVVLSEATSPGTPARETSRVGVHTLMGAPIAPVFVAWAAVDEQRAWIERGRAQDPTIEPSVLLAWLGRIRATGYMLHGADWPGNTGEDVIGQAVRTLQVPGISGDAISVHVPVFATDGSVALLLRARGFRPETSRSDLQRAIDKILRASAQVTDSIGEEPLSAQR